LIKKLKYKKPELKIHGDLKEITNGPLQGGIETSGYKSSLIGPPGH
jgi:hypothetical protein